MGGVSGTDKVLGGTSTGIVEQSSTVAQSFLPTQPNGKYIEQQ